MLKELKALTKEEYHVQVLRRVRSACFTIVF